MNKLQNQTNHKYSSNISDINPIINSIAIGLLGFGLLFVEQRVLKFFIFPRSLTTLIDIRWYSLLVYVFIFIEIARRIKYKIQIGSSFILLVFLYIIYFLSYIINTSIFSFYAILTNFIFGFSIEIIVSMLCYLYWSPKLVKFLPYLFFAICIISLYFFINPSEKLAFIRILAYGAEFSKVSSGLYYYPGQVGLIGAFVFALAFSQRSYLLTAIIAIFSLSLTILSIERAPLIGLVLGLLTLLIFTRYRLNIVKVLLLLLLISGSIIFFTRQIPRNIQTATNVLKSRFELGSSESVDQNTIIGGINARNDTLDNWVNITRESPFFGMGIYGTSNYIIENNAAGFSHNLFTVYSGRNGLIFIFIFIIITFRSFIGLWKVKNLKWGIAYLAAYLTLFSSALAHAFSPWALWIFFGIGMAINDHINNHTRPLLLLSSKNNHSI